MKCATYTHYRTVHPHLGVWIEIQLVDLLEDNSDVHPHLGVWIEIPWTERMYDKVYVHPHLGVWIEIRSGAAEVSSSSSSPPLGGVD